MSYKAFVSSTFEDLKEHRAYVIRALRLAGFFVDPMEDWPADSEEPKRFSQDRLKHCDLCVLLVALRRGYVPDGETRSITQLEYDAAVKQGIDILPFLLDENAAWPRKFDELAKDPEIKPWRDHLGKRHGTGVFTLEPRSIDLTGTLGRWFGKKNADKTQQAQERIEWREGESPYPGLFAFDDHYAPLFFGREREVDEVLARMREAGGRFLVISGASGSGKSSLVSAGVWQALLKEGRLAGSQQWKWCPIQPSEPSHARSPFEPLALGFKGAFQSRISMSSGDLAAELAWKRMAIGEVLAPHLAEGQELVLFIDQFEELFTQSFKDEDIKNFLEQLAATACDKTHRLRVLATVRSEFIARLEESEAVLGILNAGYNYHLGPVSPRILQDMIERPAKATGYEFESGLIDEMLRDAAQEPGSLPLVAYALKQLFERRRLRTFTRDAYKEVKGIAGAIGTQADQVMGRLDEESRGAFDKLFAELVHLDRERPPTRKRATLGEFSTDKAATELIDALASPDCRILVRGGGGHEALVEVAHEKLFTAWPRLKQWIDRSGEALRLIDYAGEAAKRWEQRESKIEELWSGAAAAEVLTALHRFGKQMPPELDRFLKPQVFLERHLEHDWLSHADRLRIGMKLSEFGDTRAGVGLTSHGLPDIAWIEIPAGRVRLESIDHEFEVKPFRMAKYLVTNRQFQCFIDDGGYEHDVWWEGIDKQMPTPSSWQEANCPRETVSWFEAVAFCRWLSGRTGLTIRLPSEWEWQQAATGGDPTCEYPWLGGWDATRCSSVESRLNRTTAVGMYPNGATQRGLVDMAGNVWEWCLNTFDQPDQSQAGRISADADARVRRGGSWNNGPEKLRVSYRYWTRAVFRSYLLGFRLAQDIP